MESLIQFYPYLAYSFWLGNYRGVLDLVSGIVNKFVGVDTGHQLRCHGI